MKFGNTNSAMVTEIVLPRMTNTSAGENKSSFSGVPCFCRNRSAHYEEALDEEARLCSRRGRAYIISVSISLIRKRRYFAEALLHSQGAQDSQAVGDRRSTSEKCVKWVYFPKFG